MPYSRFYRFVQRGLSEGWVPYLLCPFRSLLQNIAVGVRAEGRLFLCLEKFQDAPQLPSCSSGARQEHTAWPVSRRFRIRHGVMAG